jgi:hypothetical protein
MVMSRKDVDKVNKGVDKLTEMVQNSYRTAMENTTAVQESSTQLAQNLFKSNIEALRVQFEIQAEIQANVQRHALESVAEQIRKNRETFLGLSRGSLNAYDGFLDSLSSYYKEVSEEAEKPSD